MNQNDLINSLKEIFPSRTWPRPLHILQALSLADSGTPLREAAKAVGTNQVSVKAASQDPDRVRAVLGLGLDEIEDRYRRRATQIVGQLLLGRCAEIAFELIYKSEMHSEEFELRDLREGRTDTDYRLYNGRGAAHLPRQYQVPRLALSACTGSRRSRFKRLLCACHLQDSQRDRETETGGTSLFFCDCRGTQPDRRVCRP